MKFKYINTEDWDRLPYFNYYTESVKCTYNVTVNLDISNLYYEIRKKKLKIYPALLYIIIRTVNNYAAFRTCLDNNNALGIWEEMNPYFTIFNESTETFSLIWTQYNKDFKVFYKSCLTDIVDYKNTKEFHAKPIKTTNLINISSIPWIHFTSFNLSIEGGSNYLLPIFTIGKYLKKGDTVFLPLSVQVHHAVCDGYHLGQFIESLQALTQNCQSWLKD